MIYFIQDSATLHIKVGFTGGDPHARMAQLQTGNPSQLVLLASFPGEQGIEARLHKMWNAFRVKGEWFLPAYPIIQTMLFQQIEVFQGAERILDWSEKKGGGYKLRFVPMPVHPCG